MRDKLKTHWETVYATKQADEVSWFEESPALSLELIEAAHDGHGAVIDIGGGASRLADALLDRGYAAVSVLDLSAKALDVAKARLGIKAEFIHWIVADVTTWRCDRQYDVWHDRAAFHFLNEHKEQAAYAATLRGALKPGGVAIIGTFAPDGPERCSGLPVTRHDASSIMAVLGAGFELIGERRHEHFTPGGSGQKFQFSTFRRKS